MSITQILSQKLRFYKIILDHFSEYEQKLIDSDCFLKKRIQNHKLKYFIAIFTSIALPYRSQ